MKYLAAILLFCCSAATAQTVEGARHVMGTLLKVRVSGSDPTTLSLARDRLLDEVQHLDDVLSAEKPASDISRVNAAAGSAPVAVSPDTFDVVDQALQFARATSGSFDPTVGYLSHLWGFDSNKGHIPNSDELNQALELVDYRNVILNPAEHTVFLPYKGMILSVEGIDKGYALDHALERVKDMNGVHHIFMDFGGQLLFWDRKGSFTPERVTIESPDQKGRVLSTIVIRSNGSVSTSSNAERFFTAADPRTGQAKRYGHIMDPRTASPVERTASVTVVAPTGTEAGAYATALFVLGWDGLSGMEHQPPVEALFLTQDSVRGWVQQSTPGWPK